MLTNVSFEFPFIWIGKLTVAFSTGQSIMVRAQNLVHMLESRTRISLLFRRWNQQEFSIVYGAGFRLIHHQKVDSLPSNSPPTV